MHASTINYLEGLRPSLRGFCMERLDWARDLLVLRSYSCMVPCSRPVYVHDSERRIAYTHTTHDVGAVARLSHRYAAAGSDAALAQSCTRSRASPPMGGRAGKARAVSVLLAPLLLRAPLRLLRGTLAVTRRSGGYLRQGC